MAPGDLFPRMEIPPGETPETFWKEKISTFTQHLKHNKLSVVRCFRKLSKAVGILFFHIFENHLEVN